MEKEKLWSTLKTLENNFDFISITLKLSIQWMVSKAFTIYVVEKILYWKIVILSQFYKINKNYVIVLGRNGGMTVFWLNTRYSIYEMFGLKYNKW